MTLEPRPGGFRTRLRFGKGLRERFLIATTDEAVAVDREKRMEKAAAALARLNNPQAREFLLEMGRVASDEKAFRALERVVDKLRAEAGAGSSSPPESSPASGPLTFRAVAELWTSGKLHAEHPDRVKPQNDRSRYQTVGYLAPFLPVLGGVAFPDITDALVQQAKARIPKGLDPDSRRLYLSRLRSVFRYAVKPLKLIATVPEEIADLPRVKKRNLFWFLYPDEEARLLGCRQIPLAYRVLYGWLSRNGGRIAETCKLDYAHLDLERGRVRIEASWAKTGRARFWDLEPDVLLAMAAWHLLDGSKTGEARVFHAPTRKTLSPATILDRLHDDLLLAGIDRAELHATTKGSRRMRVHDFRTGFCTLARRRGMADTWIMDRSGHESVAQLEQYAKLARHADEAGLPVWWAPMHEAIPELASAVAAGVGQGWASATPRSQKRLPSQAAPFSITETGTPVPSAKPLEKLPVGTPITPVHPTSGPAGFQGVGQPGPPELPVDPVEQALAYALSEATKDHRYDVVLAVTRELEQRRLARSASNVTSIADARKKRDGESK